MRSVSTTMKRKLASRIQAGDNAISASLWVGRPTTPLTDDNFLEKQTVLHSDNITKTSLAVCHPTISRGATYIYFAYIESGELKITRTYYADIMEHHEWEPVEFSERAEDVALCFDGTMPKAPGGWIEFKTEQVPWVFWVLNGMLFGRKLDDHGDPAVLAEANCSAVSAVRAMWSSHGGFDFGLVVFFLLNGQLYYRQLINGEWTDAEVVLFGPSNVSWVEVSAFRTWDYRIGVQAKTADGYTYELFTQFMGIGKQTTEHMVVNADADGCLTEIQYRDGSNTEHINVDVQLSGALIYALSSMPVLAFNITDEEDNWGKLVVVRLDYPVTVVDGNGAAFSLIDSNGVEYRGLTSEASDDGLSVTIEFTDINNAVGECILRYTPGTIQSPAVAMESWSIAFLPVNLVPVAAEPPKVMEVWNE